MEELPSFAEFAAPKFHRRLIILAVLTAPVAYFLGERGALMIGQLIGSRRFGFGIPPEFLRFIAPAVWVVGAGVIAFLISVRSQLSKILYKLASIIVVADGLAAAGLAFYTSTTRLDDGTYLTWAIVSLVAAALGGLSLWTSRRRMDWQFYEAA
jgi:hypothetical protein